MMTEDNWMWWIDDLDEVMKNDTGITMMQTKLSRGSSIVKQLDTGEGEMKCYGGEDNEPDSDDEWEMNTHGEWRQQ